MLDKFIYLRPIIYKDYKNIYNWRKNPKIWKYTNFTWKKNMTLDLEKFFLKRSIQNRKNLKMAIIYFRQNKNIHIGNVQITNIVNDQAVFHIFIGDPKFWNRGIGYIATKLFIQILELNTKIRKLKLYVHKKNLPAIKLYKKIGFILKKYKLIRGSNLKKKNNFLEMIYH